MITIRNIRPDDWKLIKSLRLTALADAPYAFAETLDEARQMPDSRWQSRTQQNSEGKTSTGALAFDGEKAIGMAVGLLDQNDRNQARLVAMWVAPDYRGSGIAESLTDVIVKWASVSGVTVLTAEVSEHNLRAQSFYRKVGFEFLPDRRPWPPDPTKCEISMQMVLKKQGSKPTDGQVFPHGPTVSFLE